MLNYGSVAAHASHRVIIRTLVPLALESSSHNVSARETVPSFGAARTSVTCKPSFEWRERQWIG